MRWVRLDNETEIHKLVETYFLLCDFPSDDSLRRLTSNGLGPSSILPSGFLSPDLRP